MLELKLYDTIGGWGITAGEFIAQIPQDATEITLRINSPGGDVADGLAIYNYLKDHPARVVTVVDGYAASSASVVMLAGDEIQVHKSSIVMVHNPWTLAMGNADDMRHTADVLDEHGKAILDIYMDATGMSESDLSEMMKDETWMRGEAALENGFATSLIDSGQEEQSRAAASAQWASIFNAINGGKELMSTQKTRRDIEAKAAETEAKLVTVTGERDALTAKVTEITAASEVVTGELAQARTDLESATVTVGEHLAKIEDMQKVAEKATVRITSLEATIKDPAFKDAAMIEAENLAQAAADAEADKAEAEAQAKIDADAKAKAEADKPTLAKWKAIEDNGERTAYWTEHRAELKAEADKAE